MALLVISHENPRWYRNSILFFEALPDPMWSYVGFSNWGFGFEPGWCGWGCAPLPLCYFQRKWLVLKDITITVIILNVHLPNNIIPSCRNIIWRCIWQNNAKAIQHKMNYTNELTKSVIFIMPSEFLVEIWIFIFYFSIFVLLDWIKDTY